MASIKDVAKEAEVSISTVSKVLKNYPNISQATKDKVNKAISKLGFVPNAAASMLSSKRAGRIALLINPNSRTEAIDQIYMQYITGAIGKAKEEKLDIVTLFFSMIAEMTLEEITSYLQAQNITGVIICGLNKKSETLHRLIDKQQFKFVIVDAPIYNDSASSIWIDNAQAQAAVIKATMKNVDCKKLLYIAGKSESYVNDERIRGLEEITREYQIEYKILNGDFSELKARNITLQYGKDYDIIACGSDLMAIGAMKALMELDVFHPVCGFDGIALMGYVGKQMNTVKQDFAKISESAVEELAALMKGKKGENIITPYKLVRMRYEDIIC